MICDGNNPTYCFLAITLLELLKKNTRDFSDNLINMNISFQCSANQESSLFHFSEYLDHLFNSKL